MKISLTFIFILSAFLVRGQDFEKGLTTARSSYSAGKLDDARFAMQQMIQELDILIGKEVLQLLPAKMNDRQVNSKDDNVAANTGLAGVLIHRSYGSETKTADIDIMSNSPLVASLNAILALPMVGNSGDGTQKVVKVGGYKSVMHKYTDDQNNTSYDVQIPFGSTLLTFKADNVTESEFLQMANTIPVSNIAAMVQ